MTIATAHTTRAVAQLVLDHPDCLPDLYADALTSEQYGRQQFGPMTDHDWDQVKAFIRSLWLEAEARRPHTDDVRISA